MHKEFIIINAIKKLEQLEEESQKREKTKRKLNEVITNLQNYLLDRDEDSKPRIV
jgi:ribose 5-phosphate isomerase